MAHNDAFAANPPLKAHRGLSVVPLFQCQFGKMRGNLLHRISNFFHQGHFRSGRKISTVFSKRADHSGSS